MKILFLTTILLSKRRNGGEVASQCFIDALRSSGHQVSVVGYLRKDDISEQKSDEILVVDERYTETSKAKFFSGIWLFISFFKRLPYSSAKYYSSNYIEMVKELVSTHEYDIFIIDHTQLFWLEKFVKNKKKLVTIAHNIEHEIYVGHSKNTRSFILRWIYKREACLIKKMEDRLAINAQEVWTLTQHDSKYFSSIKKTGVVRVFTLCTVLGRVKEKPISKSFDIGLLGSWSWRTNEEALQWFLQTVYLYLPDNLSIHVAGKGAEWLTGKYSNIQYRNVVPDAQEFMAQAKVVAIPSVSGNGIQIKTLDAIASGSAIVATPVALRGISDPPKTVKVAKHPKDFAGLLVAAIASSSIQEAGNDALDWCVTKRDKFLADVACAISNL